MNQKRLNAPEWQRALELKVPPLALALPVTAGLPMPEVFQGDGSVETTDTLESVAVAVCHAMRLLTASPTYAVAPMLIVALPRSVQVAPVGEV